MYKDPKWNEIHETIKLTLQREIDTMRELLANMHQEELSLLLQNRETRATLLEERGQLIMHLGSLRSERISAMDTLEKTVGKEHAHPTVDELLPLDEGISSEIRSLSEQLLAITDKMNEQNARNQQLDRESVRRPSPKLQVAPAKKRRNSIATIPRDP